MIDLPAGILANQAQKSPTPTRPTAADAPQPEADASPAPPASPKSDAPATEGDRVTILSKEGPPRGEQPAGIDTSSLQGMLDDIRQSMRQAQPDDSAPRQLGIGGFSLQDLLGSFGQNQITNRIEQLGRDLTEWMEKLEFYDPEQAQRLGLLLNLLSKLNPEGFEDILGRVADTLEAFSGIFQGAGSAGEAAMEAQAQAEQTQQAGQNAQATEIVHFSLDIEVSSSSQTTAVIQQMKDEGIEVQAVQVAQSSTVKIHIEFTGVRQMQQSDPLVLDLDGDGIDLASADQGAVFDIDADGKADRTGFVRGDDALLAIDRNGNGRIDDGSELFGDQNGAVNGFGELAKYDDNADGKIDAKDKIFDSLRLLHDVDADGMVRAYELSKLTDKGVESLDLGYADSPRQDDGKGNTLAERSAFTRTDGTRGALVDVWLGHRA